MHNFHSHQVYAAVPTIIVVESPSRKAMADAEEKPPSRSFRSFIWDTDTHLKTPEERKLLRKLDWSILTIGCLGFFMKYLDQGNLTNAYVSGLQEDLNMYGNEYTYAQTAYTCAYAVMQIPSTLIVQKVRPSVWLVFMEVGWVGNLDLGFNLFCYPIPKAAMRHSC